MKIHTSKVSFILAAFLLMSACSALTPKQEVSLYDRLGGIKAIRMVVNDFIDTVGADKRIQNPKVLESLEKVDIAQLKTHISNQVCMAAGGPCEYKGRDMKSSHADLAITGAEFGYVVDDLIKTLDKYKVPEKEKNELLGLLGPMKDDIVTVPSSH